MEDPLEMDLAYITLSTNLCGGNKIVFEHVRLLNEMGVKAAVVSREPFPEWLEYQIPFVQVRQWSEVLGHAKFYVATFYSVLLELWNIEALRGRLIHFCQGYEAEYDEAKPFIDKIMEAYSLPCPIWTISTNLARKLSAKFPAKKIEVVGQPLDTKIFYPDPRHVPKEPPLGIVLVGPLDISIKGIKFGLKVLRAFKNQIPNIKVVRISQADTRKKESGIFQADEYYVGVAPREVGNIFRKNHILLSPSLEGEGFGLPPLEAMACGMATCLSAISSYLSWDSPQDYALFFKPQNLDDALKKLTILAKDTELRNKIGRRGLQVAKKFSPEQVGEKIVRLLEGIESCNRRDFNSYNGRHQKSSSNI